MKQKSKFMPHDYDTTDDENSLAFFTARNNTTFIEIDVLNNV